MLKCDLNEIGLSLEKIVKAKSIAHPFILTNYLLLLTSSVWNIIMSGSDKSEIYKKKIQITQIRSLQPLHTKSKDHC